MIDRENPPLISAKRSQVRSEKSKTGLIISDHKIGGITVTLFESVFAGNDAVYGLTENAIDQAIETHGADKAVSFPNTAYSLPCYYAVTGTKVGTLAELKEALAVVKTLMTREKRTHDAFMSGVATAPCA